MPQHPIASRLVVAILAALSGATLGATESAVDETGAGVSSRADKLPRVEVVGTAAESTLQPGSTAVVDQRELESSRTLTVN